MTYIFIENYKSLIVNHGESINFEENIKFIFGNFVVLENNKIYICLKNIPKEIKISNSNIYQIDNIINIITTFYILCDGYVFIGNLNNDELIDIERINCAQKIKQIELDMCSNKILFLLDDGTIFMHINSILEKIELSDKKIKLMARYHNYTIFVTEDNKFIKKNRENINILSVPDIISIECDIIQVCPFYFCGTSDIFILDSNQCFYKIYGKYHQNIIKIINIGNIAQIGNSFSKFYLRDTDGNIYNYSKKSNRIIIKKIHENKLITGILFSHPRQIKYAKNARND